jgi:hypothetical protein
VLEDTNIKIASVISDVLGKSGRAILDALVAGETEPQKCWDQQFKPVCTDSVNFAPADGNVSAARSARRICRRHTENRNGSTPDALGALYRAVGRGAPRPSSDRPSTRLDNAFGLGYPDCEIDEQPVSRSVQNWSAPPLVSGDAVRQLDRQILQSFPVRRPEFLLQEHHAAPDLVDRLFLATKRVRVEVVRDPNQLCMPGNSIHPSRLRRPAAWPG